MGGGGYEWEGRAIIATQPLFHSFKTWNTYVQINK